jgi:hypothetical protein
LIHLFHIQQFDSRLFSGRRFIPPCQDVFDADLGAVAKENMEENVIPFHAGFHDERGRGAEPLANSTPSGANLGMGRQTFRNTSL